MLDHTLTTKQVLELVPMGPASLSDLVRRGIIVPSKGRGVGRGVPSLYTFYDLVGIASVEFIRPKATSTTVMSALFAFWQTPQGKVIIENAPRVTGGVVVVDGKGRVSYEPGDSIQELFERRQASMLHILRPHPLVQQLWHDYALKRMTEPLPSGRLPRKPRPAATEDAPRRAKAGSTTRERGEMKQRKSRAKPSSMKRLQSPTLLRGATERHGKKNGRKK